MTSPVVSFIDTFSEENIFTGGDVKLKDVLALANKNYSRYFMSFLSTSTIRKILSEFADFDMDLATLLKQGKIPEIPGSLRGTEIREWDNAVEAIKEVEYYWEQVIDDTANKIIKKSKGHIDKSQARSQAEQQVKLDLEEFENVLEGAEEFSNLGKLLGANQGLKTSKVDQLALIQRIEQIFSSRVSKGKLDFRRYLVDPEYAEEIRLTYNTNKKCVNIFDVVDHIAQYNSIFKIFSAVLDTDYSISVKTRIYDIVYKEVKEQTNSSNMSDNYQKRLLGCVDNLVISKFLERSNITIPYLQNTVFVTELGQKITTKEDGFLTFDSPSSIGSFKYYFERVVIPNLKRGFIIKSENEKIVQIVDKSLSANQFVQSLVSSTHGETPLYKCDLDMLTVENSQDSKIRFQQYIKGLQQLSNIWVTDSLSLSDMFVLYNLIVNKNQYGSDRMTTIFDYLVRNSKEFSIINKYLKFVGNLDYSDAATTNPQTEIGNTITSNDIHVMDFLVGAASTVKYEKGQEDPSYIINTNDGPVFKIKKGRDSYESHDVLLPQISGESVDERLDRLWIRQAYFTLGGSFSNVVDELVNSIRNNSDKALDNLKDLLKKGILKIYRVCK